MRRDTAAAADMPEPPPGPRRGAPDEQPRDGQEEESEEEDCDDCDAEWQNEFSYWLENGREALRRKRELAVARETI